jgi:hypothetical protein
MLQATRTAYLRELTQRPVPHKAAKSAKREK